MVITGAVIAYSQAVLMWLLKFHIIIAAGDSAAVIVRQDNDGDAAQRHIKHALAADVEIVAVDQRNGSVGLLHRTCPYSMGRRRTTPATTPHISVVSVTGIVA